MSKKVLIASPEANVRLALRNALERTPYGLRVDEAVDSARAVEQAASARYAAVVIDTDEPAGMASAEHLLGKRGREQVIILTSRASVREVTRAMKLGAADVLEKPATPLELHRVIDGTILRRHVLFRGRKRTHAPPATESPTQPARRPAARRVGAEREGGALSYLECVDLARQAMASRDLLSARGWIREALSVDAERPETFNLLGVIAEIQLNDNQASKYYRAAIALDPMYEPSRNNLHRLSGFRPAVARDLGEDWQK